MKFHHAHLVDDRPADSDDCTVAANAKLIEVLRKTASGGRPFLIVENEVGAPIGVVAAEDVLKRVTDPHPSEVGRWMDMPVEAALNSRLCAIDGQGRDTPSDACTTVTHNGGLLGVVTDDDLLISWRSVQHTLQTSQGDAVTQLPNRASFDQHLKAECNRGRRAHSSVAVVLIDLDFFKQINDQYGHAAGDAALRTIATAIRDNLRSYDLVARFGGDEFAAICSGCRPGEIDIVVRRIRECIGALPQDPHVPRPVPTVSVGACVAHDVTQIANPAEIVRMADEALYAAKAAGRNCAFKTENGHAETRVPILVPDSFTGNQARTRTELQPASF